MGKNNNKSNNEDEQLEILTLELDDNKTLDCQILAVIEVDKQDYIYLLPMDSSYQSEEGEFFIYRYFEDEDENITLENDLSDEEFEKAADAYDELLDASEYDEIITEDF